jgi:hypothetical protein
MKARRGNKVGVEGEANDSTAVKLFGNNIRSMSR